MQQPVVASSAIAPLPSREYASAQPLIYCPLPDFVSRLERGGVGIVALEPDGHILMISAVAERLLPRCDVTIADDRIVPGRSANGRAIKELVAADAPLEASRVLQYGDAGNWLVVRSVIAPVSPDGQAPAEMHRILALRDPTETSQHDLNLLAKTFGLTRRESELACHLAAGLPLARFSELQHVSLNTARSHLKGVFRKLEVCTQVELVCRLLAVLR